MKSCGACRHFQKLKTMRGNSGLCNYYDCRANADGGSRCQQFKRTRDRDQSWQKKLLMLVYNG